MKSCLVGLCAIIIMVSGILIIKSAIAETTSLPDNPDLVTTMPDNLPKASFAGGCFWCLESEFRSRPGVVFTRVGYEGGSMDNPAYEDVTTGKTGHTETIEIYFDPAKTSYQALLDHFLLRAHDPTTLNQQWVDKGTQYRSAIFYHDEAQKKAAEETIARIDAEKVYQNPIVTEVLPAASFWVGEDYHQQYYEKYEKKYGEPHIRVITKETLKKKRQ